MITGAQTKNSERALHCDLLYDVAHLLKVLVGKEVEQVEPRGVWLGLVRSCIYRHSTILIWNGIRHSLLSAQREPSVFPRSVQLCSG